MFHVVMRARVSVFAISSSTQQKVLNERQQLEDYFSISAFIMRCRLQAQRSRARKGLGQE